MVKQRERIRLACLLGILATIAFSTCAQNTDYSIVSWEYGVVVWPGRTPSDTEHFCRRLSAAAKTAFAFWSQDPPEAPEGWAYPVEYAGRLHSSTGNVRIVDAQSDQETEVPPLRWLDRELSPVVVIAFSDGWRMRDSLGTTATFGARFHFGSTAGAYPDAEDWVREVGRAGRTMICVSYAGDDTVIHEIAHWFLVEWCEASGVNPWRVPDFIHEGAAETTSAHAKDSTQAPWERQAVIDWAERHCLSDGVGAASVYTVGESLVTYLIDELGEAGFLGTLAVWAARPEMLIERYEAGWRSSIGLPNECNEHPSGSE